MANEDFEVSLQIPEMTTLVVNRLDSLGDLLMRLPYGYPCRVEYANLLKDLAMRDGQLDACGTIMSRDRKKAEAEKTELISALRACEREFGRHNLPINARSALPPLPEKHDAKV